MDTLASLIIASCMILIGFCGELIFKKTDVPNVLWLVFCGLLLGQVFQVLDRLVLSSFVDLFSAIAIVIILFGGGLNFKIEEVAQSVGKGVFLMLLGAASSIGVTVLIMSFFGFSLLNGLLMGLILCGTSSAIVIPIVTKMKQVSTETKVILSFESISDTFTIALAFITMRAILLQTSDVYLFVGNIVGNIAIGTFFGVIGGLSLDPIMRTTRKEDFSYAVMLAILFLIYSLTEYFDGSGPISVFVAGFALANSKQLLRRKDSNRRSGFDPLITRMHSSISFLIRTFFFVYVGAIVFIDNVFGLIIGIMISLGFLAVRPLIVKVVSRFLKRERKLDKRVMAVMFPRGLSAAILAVLPYSMGILNTEAFADIVFTVIIGTTCIATIGIMAIKKLS